jgi:hypothetical protein
VSNEPREGLPPCQKFATFENRVASLLDKAVGCDGNHTFDTRFWVLAGMDGGTGSPKVHPGYRAGSKIIHGAVIVLSTDDPDEAQAAFERGAEWVRTGEGP